MNWLDGSVKTTVKLRESLSRHTSFKIGGRARYFTQPRGIKELKLLINRAKRYNIPVLVIGSGSNILVSDSGVKALVIRLNAAFFRTVSSRGDYIEAGAGLSLGRLAAVSAKLGLSGAEFLSGIPGTLAGALVMNAGITEGAKSAPGKVRSIGDLVQSATVMGRDGKIKVLKKKDLKFGYRKSNFSGYIILSALLKLKKEERSVIVNRISGYLSLRKDKLDLSRPSAGCVFKNPAGNSAGRLIDLCGLKGAAVGGACVSQKHANFILNTGNASANDVLDLMAKIKRRVKKKFGVRLQPEIKIWK